MEKQKTIKSEISFSGPGLHSGNPAKLRICPAAEHTGIRFIRVDLPNKPEIKIDLDQLLVDEKGTRCTSLRHTEAAISTVEHFLSVLAGLGVDNIIAEVDAEELPGLDGSGQEFLAAIKRVGLVEQDAPRSYIEIREPLSVSSEGSSILVVPDKDFKISYSLSYPHPFLNSQFFSTTVDQVTFEKEIAPCRTFCLEAEASQLKSLGYGKGASYENTLVIGDQGPIKNRLQFSNEPARHKALDLIGDMYLLGRPIKGHFFAVRSGHSLNIALLKKIQKHKKQYDVKGFIPTHPLGDKVELSVEQIMGILPHRYPFLLVDRIISVEKGKKAVGYKNVTINDGFFRGHFPTRPIMPGVLMVEALAQVGGVLVLTDEAHRGKLALFLATDQVKFRRMVVPGDQLILEVEMLRDRTRTATLMGKGWVGEELVVEAEITFSFVESDFLG